jgi:uncharacterized protein YabN with tetrapyrrole methylase and pyrophosphatase domain
MRTPVFAERRIIGFNLRPRAGFGLGGRGRGGGQLELAAHGMRVPLKVRIGRAGMKNFRVFARGCGLTPGTMQAMDELKATIARLRAPDGCPWDQEQTHASLVRCLIDEVSELIDTIDRGDLPHMREELGDVLIQVVFHAQIAAEAGAFTLEDVAREVNEKLVRRHPHVFGTGKLWTSDEVLVQWEVIKAQEKKHGPVASGVFKDLPARLPALMFAEAVWKQIEKKALPAPADALVDSAQVRALGARLTEAELGKMLFEVTAAARARGLDPEGALRLHATQVMRAVEARVAEGGKP